VQDSIDWTGLGWTCQVMMTLSPIILLQNLHSFMHLVRETLIGEICKRYLYTEGVG